FKAAGTDHLMIIYEMPPQERESSPLLSFPPLDKDTSLSPYASQHQQNDMPTGLLGPSVYDTTLDFSGMDSFGVSDLSGLEFSSLDSSCDAYPTRSPHEDMP